MSAVLFLAVRVRIYELPVEIGVCPLLPRVAFGLVVSGGSLLIWLNGFKLLR